MKICSKCLVSQEETNFHKCKGNKDCTSGFMRYIDTKNQINHKRISLDSLVYSTGDGFNKAEPIVGAEFGCVHHEREQDEVV